MAAEPVSEATPLGPRLAFVGREREQVILRAALDAIQGEQVVTDLLESVRAEVALGT
jgi:hypothetical protein